MGRLYGSRRGKKIDTWEFTIDRVKYRVPVHMGGGDEGTLFSARWSDGEHNGVSIDLWDKDIDVLRTKFRKELEANVRITWSTYIYITFSHSCDPVAKPGRKLGTPEQYRAREGCPDKFYDVGREFDVYTHFEYTFVEIGTNAAGQQLHRHLRRNLYSHASPGLPEVGVEADDFHEEGRRSTKALLPVTQENLDKLETMRAAFQQLSQRLEKFLRPEGLEARISQITSLLPPVQPSLPPPRVKKPNKAVKKEK